MVAAALWLALAAGVALAARSPAGLAVDGSPWFGLGQATLMLEDETLGYQANWVFEIGPGAQELRLAKDERHGTTSVRGTLLVLGGAAMLSRGIELTPGEETEAVGGPALILELSLRVLERAFPQGPESVGKKSRFALREEHQAIQLVSPLSGGAFQAPWTARGWAGRAADGAVSFRFRLVSGSARRPEGDYRVRVTGSWRRLDPPPRSPDDMPLAGWDIHLLGVRPTRDEGAQPDPRALDERYQTLGELRRAIGRATLPDE
jgi:hypothetical protein